MEDWSSNDNQYENAPRPPIPNRSFSGDDLSKSNPKKPLVSFSRSTSLVATLPARGLPLPPPLPPLPPAEVLRRQVPFDSEYIPQQNKAPLTPKRRLVSFARGPKNDPSSLPPLPPKPLTRYKSVEKGLNASSFDLRSNSPPPPMVPPRPVTSHGVQSSSTPSDMPPVPPRPNVLINSPVSDSSDDSWSIVSPQMTDLPASWLATTSPSSSRNRTFRSFLPSTSPPRPHTALPSLNRKIPSQPTPDSHPQPTPASMPVPNQPNNNAEHAHMDDAELKHVLNLSLAESEQTLKAQQQEDEELAKAIAESLAISKPSTFTWGASSSSSSLIPLSTDKNRSGSRPSGADSSPGLLQIPNDKSYLDLSSPFEKEALTPASLFLDMDDAAADGREEEDLAMQLQQEETRQMAVDILDREDITRRDAQLTRQIHEDARRREEELLEREKRDRDTLEREMEIDRARNHLREVQEQRDAELARLMSKWEQTGPPPPPDSVVPSSQSPPHLLTQPFSIDSPQTEQATLTANDDAGPLHPPKLSPASPGLGLNLNSKIATLTPSQNPASPTSSDQQDVSVSRSHSGSSTIGRESTSSHLHQPSPGWSRDPSPGPRGVSASPGNNTHNHNGNTGDNTEDDLLADLKGFSYGFTPPNIPVSPPQASAPCAPFPDIINLSPAPYPPFNIMAPSWRHLLRLLARQETRVQAHIDVIANRKEEQQLRVVVQFVKLAYTANTWRTIIYLSLDEPFPSTVPASATTRFTNGDTTVLPYSYAISDHGRNMTGPNMHIYAIPLSTTSPFPILPITFPNLALYLQSAMQDSRARKVRHDSFRRLAKVVQSCYPEEVMPPTQEERKPSRGVGNLFKRVVGRGSNDRREATGNEDVFDMITPFRLDQYTTSSASSSSTST